jgi:O-antigen/teichoic acid export membrane protein
LILNNTARPLRRERSLSAGLAMARRFLSRVAARATSIVRADQSLTQQSLIYIGAAGVNVLVPFAVLPWLTRWLGPEGFGTVGTLVAMISVSLVLVGLNTNAQVSVTYFRDGPASMPVQIGATLGVLALTGVLLLIGLQLNAGWISAATGISGKWLWTISVSACGQFVVAVTLSAWQTRGLAWRYGATQIGYTVLWASLSLALIGYFGMDWTGRAMGQAFASIIAAILCIVLLTRKGFLSWNFRDWPVGSALRFGLPLVPHSLAAIAMGTVDRIALGGAVGGAATGHYFAAFQIASVLSLVGAALNQAWIPWMYGRLARKDEASKLEIVRATYLLSGLLLASAVLISIGAVPIVRIIAGPGYEESADLLRFLAPAAAFGGMYYLMVGYLFYAGRTGLLSTITLTVASIQIVLVMWLVSQKGAKGAAIAVLLSSIIYWAATALVANLVIPLPWLRRRIA